MNLKPGWMRCPDCSGHGPYDGEAGDKCKTCDGSGTIKLTMTSRPAAPKADPLHTKEWLDARQGEAVPCCGVYENCVRPCTPRGIEIGKKMLERRLSLAQTEIKGHMRAGDELKEDVEHWRSRAVASEHNFAIEHEEVVKAQLHIAKLEMWLDNNTTYHEGPNAPVLATISKRIWYHATDDTANYPFSAAIKAALKDRA